MTSDFLSQKMLHKLHLPCETYLTFTPVVIFLHLFVQRSEGLMERADQKTDRQTDGKTHNAAY